MNRAEWIALLPLIVASVGVAILLLVVSFRRHHGLAAYLTVALFAATLATIPSTLSVLPRAVTPLVWLDRYAAYFFALFSAAALVTAMLSHRYLQRRRGDLEEYYVLLGTATIGAMTMAAAAHFATFLLGLEILSISLYVLVGYPEERQAPLEAALKYLLLSGVASTTMLFGMALIYLDTGTLSFNAIAGAVRDNPEASTYLLVGNALLFAGIAFKLSLVPFHMWTPDVYEGAPAPVAGYLATVGKAAVFALALRYVVQADVLAAPALFFAMSVIAGLSMVIGNLLALLQRNIKRILAYSSIAHIGYLLIAMLLASKATDVALGVETALVYLAAYFAMTLGAFGIVAVASSAETGRDADAVSDFDGLFWRRPLLAASFAVVLLSLAGIPMTLGFIAKFYLFAAGVEGSLWFLLWALIVGSGIGLFYYLRIIFAMTRTPDTDTGFRVQGTFADVSVLVGLAIVLLAFGVYPTPLIDLVRAAVSAIGFAPGALVGAP